MRFDLNDRCVLLGQYIVENDATVRETAVRFGVSKSTVHKDVTEKLKRENGALYQSVKQVLDTNKSERHLRGGEATRRKYEMMKHMRDRNTAASKSRIVTKRGGTEEESL